MNLQNVKKWCREFSERRTDVHDEQRSGRTSLISDDLPQAADFYNAGVQKLVPRLNKCLKMPANILKNEVTCKQFIHNIDFVN
jgi:hypothetical protein